MSRNDRSRGHVTPAHALLACISFAVGLLLVLIGTGVLHVGG